MGHHHHHHSFEDERKGNKKGLLIALVITFSIMLVEFFGGLITNSLALLSDAGHMLGDSSSLLLSFAAISIASRHVSRSKSFGLYRFEILAALINGVTLFVIAFFIVWEAYNRFHQPPEVSSGPMMVVALIGLLANLLSAWFLHREGDVKNNVNLRGAYLHILGDALGSVGALLAGALMLAFQWYIADPIISVVVALLILKSAWGILAQSTHILMEGSPSSVNQDDVSATLLSLPGVIDIHDLHIWTITSGLNSLSCHVVIEELADSQKILQQAIDAVNHDFGISHTTFQIETPHIKHKKCPFEDC